MRNDFFNGPLRDILTMQDTLNLEILKVPELDEFDEELDFVLEMIHYNQSHEFFEIMLMHLKNGVDEELGIKILDIIARLLCNNVHLSTFISGGFANMLPFSNKSYTDMIFEVLFVVTNLGPHCFEDEALCRSYGHMIKRNPSKALTLFGIFAEKFNEFESPWAFLDLLIHESKRFVGPELASNYSNLLASLCVRYPDYAEGRASHCWKKICSLLNEQDIGALRCIYSSLSAIAKVYKDGNLPIESIKGHLHIKELHRSILTLLAHLPLAGNISRDEDVLRSLCLLAERDEKATLVLMESSKDLTFASFLVDNAEKWMGRELPTNIDTLRLFLVVFQHSDLRNRISQAVAFTDFLKLVTEQENSKALSIVCTIIRRVEISLDLLARMSESGFLRVFFEISIEIGSHHSSLLLLDTLAQVGYTREYIKMCDLLYTLITKKDNYSELAAEVAIRLCTYSKCVLLFKRKKLDDFMRKNIDDPTLSNVAEVFLDAVGN